MSIKNTCSSLKIRQNIVFPKFNHSFSQRNHRRTVTTGQMLDNYTNNHQYNPNNKRNVDLMRIKIDVQNNLQDNSMATIDENKIIEQLKDFQKLQKNEELQHQHSSKIFHQRNIHSKSEVKNRNVDKFKQEYKNIFKNGFLPQVQKFYNTYKKYDRQVDKMKLLRKTVYCQSKQGQNQLQNEKMIKLVKNINEYDSIPKKLGLVGRNSCHQINHKDMHLTRKQIKTISKGLLLFDIKKYNLSNNKLQKSNGTQLFKNIPQKVQKINLKHTLPNKQVLNLLNCQTLKAKTLKTLNLSDNKITDLSILNLEYILIQNSSLQILNLSQNLLTDQSCKCLGNIVQVNYNLRNLNVSRNKITGKLSFSLLQAVTNSISLLSFNISWNQLGNQLKTKNLIAMNQYSDKSFQNKTKNALAHQKSTLQYLCQMIKKNRHLLHANLSNNFITKQQSQQIASAFNVYNQNLLGFHFQGNSNLSVNALGYLIQNQIKELSHPRSSHLSIANLNHHIHTHGIKNDKLNNQANARDVENIGSALKNTNYHYFDNSKFQVKKINRQFKDQFYDQCLMCDGWIIKKFTFKIPKKTFQLMKIFKQSRFHKQAKSATQNQNDVLKDIFIHLDCYSFQPLLLTYNKQKKNIKQKFLPHQNNKTIAEFQKKSIEAAFKIIGTFNTITNCDNLSTNSLKMLSQPNHQQDCYSYQILVNIPKHKKVEYFFTIDGVPFVDENSTRRMLQSDKGIIHFQLFNPVYKQFHLKKQKLLKGMQKGLKDKKEDNLTSLLNLIKDVEQLIPNTMKQSYKRSKCQIRLKQINVFFPEQNHKNTTSLIQQKQSLQKLYQKLISCQQQLSNEQYDILAYRKIKNIKADNKINELNTLKNLQKEKQNQKQNYLVQDTQSDQIIQNHESFQKQYKIRKKQFFIPNSYNKLINNQHPNINTIFTKIIHYMDQILDNSQKKSNQVNFSEYFTSKQLVLIENEKMLKKNRAQEDIKKLFYVKNADSLFLRVVNSQQNYLVNKINKNNFTNQIVKVGRFNETHKSNHLPSNTHLGTQTAAQAYKTKALQDEIKKRISNVMPYVLINYYILKEENNQQKDQNQHKVFESIFNLIQQKKKVKRQSTLKVSRKSKSGRKTINQSKSYSAKKSSKQFTTEDNNEYKININQIQKNIRDQNKTKSKSKGKNKQKNNNQTLNNSSKGNFLNLNQFSQEQNWSIISIGLVQQILGNKSNTPRSQHNNQKLIKQANSQKLKRAQAQLIQKLNQWKQYKQRMDLTGEQKNIIQVIMQQIQAQLQTKLQKLKKKRQQNMKQKTLKKNKFQLKINKFCSLETNVLSNVVQYDECSIKNQIKSPYKRPTFNMSEGLEVEEDIFKQKSKVSKSLFKKTNTVKFEEKIQNINLKEQIQLFEEFNNHFDQIFYDSQLCQSKNSYVQKINKYLHKLQTTKQTKQSNNQRNLKRSRTKKIQAKKQQKVRDENQNGQTKKEKQSNNFDVRTTTTKSFKFNRLKQEEFCANLYAQRQKNIHKNIFAFLQNQIKVIENYYYRSTTVYPFLIDNNKNLTQTKPQENSLYPQNFSQRLLKRIDFILINLIRKFQPLKNHGSKFPLNAKQILLKELYYYKNFLCNFEDEDYPQFINQFIKAVSNNQQNQPIDKKECKSKQILQKNCIVSEQKISKQNCQSLQKQTRSIRNSIKIKMNPIKQNEQFHKTVKIKSLQKIVSMIQHYLNYSIYFLTKQKCFYQVYYKHKKMAQQKNLSKSSKDLKKGKNKSPNEQITLMLESIRNNNGEFKQSLKKQIKSCINEYLISITKLHIQFDSQMLKIGTNRDLNKQSRMRVHERKKQRTVSIFPRESRIISVNKIQLTWQKEQEKQNINTLKQSRTQKTTKSIKSIKSKQKKQVKISKSKNGIKRTGSKILTSIKKNKPQLKLNQRKRQN